MRNIWKQNQWNTNKFITRLRLRKGAEYKPVIQGANAKCSECTVRAQRGQCVHSVQRVNKEFLCSLHGRNPNQSQAATRLLWPTTATCSRTSGQSCDPNGYGQQVSQPWRAPRQRRLAQRAPPSSDGGLLTKKRRQVRDGFQEQLCVYWLVGRQRLEFVLQQKRHGPAVWTAAASGSRLERTRNSFSVVVPFQMGGETTETPITFVLLQQVRDYTRLWGKKTHTYTTINLLRYELCFIILRQGLFLTTEVVER